MNESQKIFLPYPEVRFKLTHDAVLRVQAPWIELVMDLDESHFQTCEQWLAKHHNQRVPNFENPDTDLSYLLGELAAFPIAFCKRSSWPVPGRATTFATSWTWENLRPQQLAEAILGVRPDLDWSALPQDWPSLDLTLTWSQMSDGWHDPLCLLTALRREQLRDHASQAGLQKTAALLRDSQLPAHAAKSILIQMLAQSHYVTRHAEDCIRPALAVEAGNPDQVARFLLEEEGHFLLIEESLRALGVTDFASLPVSAEARSELDLLRWAASNHFLSFAAIVGIFEGFSFADEDGLTELLKLRPETFAAHRGVLKHHRINQQGQHGNKGLDFYENLFPVARADAVLACRISALALMMAAITNNRMYNDASQISYAS